LVARSRARPSEYAEAVGIRTDVDADNHLPTPSPDVLPKTSLDAVGPLLEVLYLRFDLAQTGSTRLAIESRVSVSQQNPEPTGFELLSSKTQPKSGELLPGPTREWQAKGALRPHLPGPYTVPVHLVRQAGPYDFRATLTLLLAPPAGKVLPF
jgi:hypothetical protein